jgi:hypothetical protein
MVFPLETKKQKHTHKPTQRNQFVITWCLLCFRRRFDPPSKSVSNRNKHYRQQYTIEIWLILPVVICLFQGLSHACLRMTALQESAHGSLHQTQSAAKMLRSPQNWIPWRNAKLIHEFTWMFSTHVAVLQSQRDVLRMNEIKTNAFHEAATPVVLIQFIPRKPVYRRLLMNNCPISQ